MYSIINLSLTNTTLTIEKWREPGPWHRGVLRRDSFLVELRFPFALSMHLTDMGRDTIHLALPWGGTTWRKKLKKGQRNVLWWASWYCCQAGYMARLCKALRAATAAWYACFVRVTPLLVMPPCSAQVFTFCPLLSQNKGWRYVTVVASYCRRAQTHTLGSLRRREGSHKI